MGSYTDRRETGHFRQFFITTGARSIHGAVMRGGRRRAPKFEEITRPWSGPILGSSFIEGGCYLYYFTFGKLRLLHQSTGGFIEENLSGLRPDIALLYPMNRNDVAEMLKMLQPKSIFVHHFDEWRSPISEGMPDETANALNGSPTMFERSILRLKPSSPSSSGPLPWSEAESEVIPPSRLSRFLAVFGFSNLLAQYYRRERNRAQLVLP
jgi:hypothetical protein